MGKIALIADHVTSTYFKVTGVKHSYAVRTRNEAETVFRKIHSDDTISLIMLTDPVYEWIKPLLEKTKKEFPLVVSIPAKGGPKVQGDVLAPPDAHAEL